jgi:hypothetical protein
MAPYQGTNVVARCTGVLSLSVVAAIAATPVSAGMMRRGTGDLPDRSPCRIIEEAARANLLPVGLLTRLLWTESRFQPDALSPKGARGVAQFMPETADERGLSNPFDPAQAIPQAARLVADLGHRFENTGLAIAAYNAGSRRVGDWLASTSTKSLPKETENFVLSVTGHSAAEWAAAKQNHFPADTQSCLALSKSLPTQPSDRRGRLLGSVSNVGPIDMGHGGVAGKLDEWREASSQYYIGYRQPDRSRNSYGASSQYYIGYRNPDGSERDGR